MLGKIKKLIPNPEWKRQYKNQVSLSKKIRKKKGRLRFNLSYLRVSDIASQFYDEKKLETEYLQGKEQTEELKIGKDGHEKLIEEKFYFYYNFYQNFFHFLQLLYGLSVVKYIKIHTKI